MGAHIFAYVHLLSSIFISGNHFSSFGLIMKKKVRRHSQFALEYRLLK